MSISNGRSPGSPCFKCGAGVGIACGCKPRGVDFPYLDAYTRGSLERAWERCESPIEIQLLNALQVQTHGHPEFKFLIELDRPSETRYGAREMVCVPQFTVLQYRADFVIFDLKRSRPECTYALVVECDGHDFHDRTKEQAARDRSRDRELTARGFTIFRFTGSQITRDPCGAADEIIAYLVLGIM